MGRYREDPSALLMNIFDYTVPAKDEEFTALLEHKNIKLVRIVSSNDLEPKVYTQEEDEWVLVIRGEAVLLLNQKEIILKEGDHLFIPSKTPHRVLKQKTKPYGLLCIFTDSRHLSSFWLQGFFEFSLPYQQALNLKSTDWR